MLHQHFYDRIISWVIMRPMMMNRGHRRLTRSSTGVELPRSPQRSDQLPQLNRQLTIDLNNPQTFPRCDVSRPKLKRQDSCRGMPAVNEVGLPEIMDFTRVMTSPKHQLSRGESFLTSNDDLTLFTRNEIMWGPKPTPSRQASNFECDTDSLSTRILLIISTILSLIISGKNDPEEENIEHDSTLQNGNKCDLKLKLVHMMKIALKYYRRILCLIIVFIIFVHVGGPSIFL